MIRTIFTLWLLAAAFALHAGCYYYAYARVNNVTIFYCVAGEQPYTSISSTWIGKFYVDSVRGGFADAYAHIYFHPGDTVYLSGVGMVTQPGDYSANIDICESVLFCTDYFTSTYLTDTLETYYKYHFDQHFIDSVQAAQIAFDDSVASVPAIFYPNPVQNIATFECFHTVQAPFDFLLFDLQGRCVLSRRVEFSGSYQIQNVDVSSLQSGNYVAKYFMNDKPYTREIIKL